jgi:hypothetical protein
MTSGRDLGRSRGLEFCAYRELAIDQPPQKSPLCFNCRVRLADRANRLKHVLCLELNDTLKAWS